MEYSHIHNISPIDGRYFAFTEKLRGFFGEAALIKYRIYVEVQYFIALYRLGIPELQGIREADIDKITHIFDDLSEEDILRVKEIEKTTNHDIKAIEYLIKEKFDSIGLEKYREFVHFGLTSQDINNTAIPLLLKDAINFVLIPELEILLHKLKEMSKQWIALPMIARTHGQPATPTTMGKELYVFYDRLQQQLTQLLGLEYPAKFGGATGNFNAHVVAYPDIDWVNFADTFVNSTLQLKRSRITTQIDHYDNLSAIFDNLKRICTILIDLDRDMWSYISFNYFKQKIKECETGSSAMPHKVNPIDFENSEGNAGIAIALFEHFSSKLPISRLQRDLSDSTVLRNTGVPLAHMVIAIKSTIAGLGKLIICHQTINKDLQENWMVLAEAIQTVLRKLNYPKPYEKLKELTRTNDSIDSSTIREFINQLEIDPLSKESLLKLTPLNYFGIIPDID